MTSCEGIQWKPKYTVFIQDKLPAEEMACLQPPNNVCVCQREENDLFEQQQRNLRCSWLKRIGPAEAQSQVQLLAKQVHSDYDKLRQILLSRETTLRARWKKKNPAQREKILLAAWSDIPPRHGLDYHHIFYPQKKPEDIGEAAYMVPHINLEDLNNPNSLLMLLYSRSRSSPGVFMCPDLDKSAIGRKQKLVGFVGLGGYFMHIIDVNTLEKRSMMMWGDSQKYGSDDFNDSMFISAANGLQILNVQARTYDFLINCCLKIFLDVPTESIISVDAPVHPDPGRPTTIQPKSYRELSTEIAAAQYNPPSAVDTGRLLRLIEARRDALEDHIHDLREDPGSFASALDEYTELGHFRKDTDRLAARQWNDDLWKHCTLAMICDVYTSFFTWDTLYQQAQGLHEASGEGFQNLDPEECLDPDLQSKIVEFIYVLQRMTTYPIHHIMAAKSMKRLKPSAEETRDLARELPRYVRRDLAKRQNNSKPLKTPLDRVFSRLFWPNDPLLSDLGPIPFVDEIQRLLDLDPQLKKNLHPFVARNFSDVAILLNTLRPLLSFYPWAMFFQGDEAEKGREYLHKVPNAVLALRVRATLTGWTKRASWPDISPPLPLAQKMHYPISKAHSELNVTALRAAEQVLDAFWAGVDETYRSQRDCTLHECFQQVCKQQIILRRTAPWEPTALQSPSQSVFEEVGQGVSSLSLETDKPTRFIPETPRVKQKTTGTPDATKPRSSDDAAPPQETENEPENPNRDKIRVSARAMSVFETMFHTRRNEVQKEEVDWKDVLHALTQAGFAAEKLYGSAWQFTPDREKLGNCGNIILHEPHPGLEGFLLRGTQFREEIREEVRIQW